MSGTDPNGKRFGKKGDPTSPFQPEGNEPERTLPHDLPKIPGITLHYEIARGGMGVVYSGRQDFLDRRVAVKFLSVDLGGAAFAQRFQREAKILAGISHPNIVGCHMADTTADGQSYLVMEFCDGPSLKAWIAENGPVAPLAAVRLIRASAMALAHAYQSDIIHRDVKPENILLETVTSTSLDIRFPFTPKIVDLGLARMTHEQVGAGLTSPGSVMGTPSTMSPEQFDDPDSVDFRSDIYGLGCCLYEMLVGHPAFRGSKLTDIVMRKRDPNAPNPCNENPQLPAAVGAFTQRLLACAREDRPESYKQLDVEANELMNVLLSERNRTDTRVGGGMDQTIPSGPGNFDATRPMGTQPARTQPAGTQPAATPPAGTQPFQQSPPSSGAPGMLNTGEFAFLAEGGPVGGGQSPPTSFRDSAAPGSSPTGFASGVAPAKSKKGLLIGVAAVVLIGGALAVVFANNGGKDPNGGDSNKTKVTATGKAANSAPTVASIKLLVRGKEPENATVDLGQTFELVADAADVDGDKLDYRWSWPTRAMNPVSQTDTPRIKFRMEDGLSGVEHVVQLEVSDADSIAPTKREIRVVVGKCREEKALIGFKATGLWKEESGSWFPINDPANPDNSGAAGRRKASENDNAVMTAMVGGEAYWEWIGTMEPTTAAPGSAAAGMIALKYGAKGYAMQCQLASDQETWSVEILERAPGGDAWRPCSPASKATWVQPKDANGDPAGESRGWFSMRRVSNQLELQVGEFWQPFPVPGEPLQPPKIVPDKQPVTLELSDEDLDELETAGQLQLIVRETRCAFRAIRR